MYVNRTIKTKPSRSARTTSSLLITAQQKRMLEGLLKRRRISLPEYLDYLTTRYGPRIQGGLFRTSKRPKKLYQSISGNYYQRNFVPENDVWIAFSQLALFLNWSRCRLFAALLQLDSSHNENPNHFSRFIGKARAQISQILEYSEQFILPARVWIRKLSLKKPGFRLLT